MPDRALPLIDLFAGCGGLSLGLEQAGFEPVFVNELNADAMESYLLNRENALPGLRSPQSHVHDILEVTQKPGELAALASRLRREHGEIGLVAGGPPCQGYSGIGHRRTFSELAKLDIPSNHLYREMAKFVDAVQPRAFLFENVRGLLSSRWFAGGEKGEIFRDVRAAFNKIGQRRGSRGYTIGWALVHARHYGVPQNRPRVLMVGVRDDIAFKSTSKTGDGLIPDPTLMGPDLVDLLGDLIDPNWVMGGATSTYCSSATNDVQRWLRSTPDGKVARRGSPLTEMEYSRHSDAVAEKFRHMLANGGEIPDHFKTKKFAQRLLPARWDSDGPSITATSLPDDYVHFAQPRVLTVREWARLQMFPDHYRFAGKRTTGGRRRAGDPSQNDWSREVPKYTQIGNAVPVELARVVGEHVRSLIA